MLKQSLQLKLGQSLTMTPQLQQAIRLLQMPTLELQAHLAEVLESNVMLEQEEPEAEEAVDFELGAHFTAAAPSTEEAGYTEPVEVEVVDQPWADRAGTGSDSGRAEDDEDRPRDLADERGESLREHLLGQLTLLGLSESDLEVAAALVDAIDDDGYLRETFAEVALDLAHHGPIGAALHDEEEIERVLLLVQKLDPVGIGARDLIECLQLQLAALAPATQGLSLAHVNAANHGAIVKAAWKGHLEVLRWLLYDEEGPQLTAQLELLDLEGRTVAELVRQNGQHEVADWLHARIQEHAAFSSVHKRI